MPPASELADILKLFSSAGAVVFLGWLLLHLFKVEIPRRDAQYSQMLKDSTDAFRATMTEQRRDFREELKVMRDNHRAEADKLTQAINRLACSGLHVEPDDERGTP